MKNAYHDGDLKSKFTNDQEVLRVATQGHSGTDTMKTTINDEKADENSSGKAYVDTMTSTMITMTDDDDPHDDYDVSTSDEIDSLSKESVGMYHSGTQVSAGTDEKCDRSCEKCATI